MNKIVVERTGKAEDLMEEIRKLTLQQYLIKYMNYHYTENGVVWRVVMEKETE